MIDFDLALLRHLEQTYRDWGQFLGMLTGPTAAGSAAAEKAPPNDDERS